MTPPAHIIGPLTRMKPQALRDERDQWVAMAHRAGMPTPQIANALGIREPSIYRAMARAGYTIPRKCTKSAVIGQMRLLGIKMGSVGDLFFGLSPACQDRLIESAMKSGDTIAGVLVNSYFKGEIK